ncbi:MAG: PQQ-binding-like beta-propeller repeat protein [Proteobacteria bacterium]|nr:PQQ-binding-like beta-propeller repeat protein [Pseudomonadota bacterium]
MPTMFFLALIISCSDATPPDEPSRPAAPTVHGPTDLDLTMSWQKPWAIVSQPLFHEGHLYLCIGQKEGEEALLKVKPDGETVWRTPLTARCVGAVHPAGERLYLRLGDGNVAALNQDNGHIAWNATSQMRASFGAHADEVAPTSLTEAPDLIVVDDTIVTTATNTVFALATKDGALLWSKQSHQAHHASLHRVGSEVALVNWGVRSALHSTGGSSSWGSGNIYHYSLQDGEVRRAMSPEGLAATLPLGIKIHFASEFVNRDSNGYVLIQLYDPPPKANIRHITGNDGVKRAIGGSRDPAKPSQLLLASFSSWSPQNAYPIPNAQMGAAGRKNYQAYQQLWDFNGLLLFTSTTQKDQYSPTTVTLHAWRDGKELWTRPNSFVLAVTDKQIVVFDDNGERPKTGGFGLGVDYTIQESRDTKSRVVLLDENGSDHEPALHLPFHPMQIPFEPQIGADQMFIVAPDMTLWAIN